MKLKRIRKILAVLVFTLLTVFLLDFGGYVASGHSVIGYLKFLAHIQFLPALLELNAVVVIALIVLTLVFGRIYCSVICPLGVFQDVVSRFNRKKNHFTYSPAKTWLRWFFVALLAVAVALGVGLIITLLAPYGTYGRFVNTLLEPIYLWINNALASLAANVDSYALQTKDVWMRSVPVLVVTVVMMVLISVLAWRNGRTWCNTVCPVGTVLGFVARFSWLKLRINEQKCISCGKCGKNCKASCIDTKNHKIDYSRCVTCGNCIDSCSTNAIYYGRKPKATAESAQPQGEGVDEARRAVLVGTAIVATEAAVGQTLKHVDGGLAVLHDKKEPARATALTPPGSLSAKNMEQRCVGCQLCVTKCPNDVLRPSTDPMHFMQPVMNYDKGFCRPECTECGDVCPAGAIQPISVAEKSSTQIGHAVWRKQYCVILADGVHCGNCAKHCPTGAIQMVSTNPQDDEAPWIPVVNEAKCIGCGSCEYVCPARPNSAIYVEGHDVHKTI